MGTGYEPTQKDLETFFVSNALGISAANQFLILQTMKKFTNAEPLLDETELLRAKASSIVRKYNNDSARFCLLNTAQMANDTNILLGINQAYQKNEYYREQIRFLNDAVLLGRTVMTIHAKETSTQRDHSAEKFVTEFIDVFTEKLRGSFDGHGNFKTLG